MFVLVAHRAPYRSSARLHDAVDDCNGSLEAGWTMLLFAAFPLAYSLRLKGRVLINYAIPQWKLGSAIFAEKVMIPSNPVVL